MKKIERQIHLFLEHAEGYGKALEKSTSRTVSRREVFEPCGQEGTQTRNQNLDFDTVEPFDGGGFGCGSVAVLVTIRDMSRSYMVMVGGKKYCMTSMGSYKLVSLDHL